MRWPENMSARSTEHSDRPDYSGLMSEVAFVLLGEPSSKHRGGLELRYGTYGSLSIDLQKNVYYDHEAGQGGGVLDLIVRENGGDYRDAVKWLDDKGMRITSNAKKNEQTYKANHKQQEHDRTDTKPNGGGGSPSRIVATYNYVDESGETLFEVVRFDPKSFRQRRPDGRGGHIWNIDGVRLVLYRLPELIRAVASGRVVYIVEGEKDADNLNAIGLPATTNPMGAGKWRDEFGEFLRGADVVILPHNDPQSTTPTGDRRFHADGLQVLPGQDHGQDVARRLTGIANRVRVVDLAAHWPECPEKGDISNWLGAGHAAEELLRLVDSTQVWIQRRDADDANKPEIKSGLLTIRAANVIPKRVDAIWKDANGGIRLARGEHTIIAGEPGLGKSQITVALAASITIGDCWPFGEGRAPLGNVIILAAEDSIEHTTVPRLIAAGADLKRVYFVQAAVAEDGKGQRMFNFQADLAKLKALIREIGDVVLVIIDPVTAYLGKIDSHKNTDVRAVLAPLGELAQEGHVAIASVTHFTKGTGSASTRAIDRIIGSIAFVAAPRIGLTVIADPDDQDRRLLLHVKNNISRSPQGLAFRLEQHIVASDEQGDFVGSCVAWEGDPVEKTADEALRSDGNKEQTAKADAVEFLSSVLANGPVKAKIIEEEARAACLLGESQLIGQSKPFRSARQALGIVPYQSKGEKAGRWLWALPGDQMPSDGSDAL